MKKLFLLLALAAILNVSLDAQTGNPLPAFKGRVSEVAGVPQNGTNCVQTLTIGGTPTAGTFRLKFGSSTSGNITWSATNATLLANINAALDAMPTAGGAGQIVATAGSLTAGVGTILLTFSGANVSAKLQAAMTVDDNSVAGGTVAVAITTAGVTADGRDLPKGAKLIDSTNGREYQNTGVAGAPVWVAALQAGQSASVTSLTVTGAGAVNLGDGAVTQATSTATGVTMNAASGVITTFTSTAAAGNTVSFVLTDSAIAAGSAVHVTIDNYSGTLVTNGVPYVTVSGIAGGSCTLNVSNIHAANALAGVLKIGVTVD